MPQKTERPARKAEGMGGLAKGLAIVEAFSAHPVMSVADAARAAGATRASARRCLITLTELGYVEHSGREFRPLTRLRRLGGVASRHDQLAQLAQPFLSRARDELAESVSLAVLDDDGALFIARAEAEHIVSTGVRIGARLPAYCSATGRVLLSQFPDQEILRRIGRKPLARRTSRTLTKPSEVLAEVRSVREKGSSRYCGHLQPCWLRLFKASIEAWLDRSVGPFEQFGPPSSSKESREEPWTPGSSARRLETPKKSPAFRRDHPARAHVSSD